MRTECNPKTCIPYHTRECMPSAQIASNGITASKLTFQDIREVACEHPSHVLLQGRVSWARGLWQSNIILQSTIMSILPVQQATRAFYITCSKSNVYVCSMQHRVINDDVLAGNVS